MSKILITGGSGFLGRLLIKELIARKYECVNIDLVPSDLNDSKFVSYQGDIRNLELLDTIFKQHNIKAIIHCAAILAHGHKNKNFLWGSNVDGTKNISECAKKHKVKNLIFISSNCLWGNGFERKVTEMDKPLPIEIYGKSKLEGEKILKNYSDYFNSVIIRCPTIIDSGRIGLLSIFFDFINEGRKVWTVGKGNNKYQFIYAKDLINACTKALTYDKFDIFNIGSDDVKSLKNVYDYVIKKADTGAKVAALPEKLTKFGMKLFYNMNLSPIGPYQYKMITENFVFDNSKIKNIFNWEPSLTNEEMLYKAYCYYHDNLSEINNRTNVSAHRSKAKMGVIKILKWIS